MEERGVGLESRLETALTNLIVKAETELPGDALEALKEAYRREKSDLGRSQLKLMLENARLAREGKIPICQDTGTINFFIKLGRSFSLKFNLEELAVRAVRRATAEVPLRPSIVHPLTRANSNDNTGVLVPYIHLELTEGDLMEVTVFPKGAGTENLGAFKNFNPSEGMKAIKGFVLTLVAERIGKGCPPGRVGLGIGGTAEVAQILSKKALLRPVGKRHREPEIAKLEEETLALINKLGVGPMGLGGAVTALGVSVEYASCHTASLPVAVSFQCWADRRASLRVYGDGGIEEIEQKV